MIKKSSIILTVFLVSFGLLCGSVMAAGPSLDAWKAKFDPSTAKYRCIVSNVSHPVLKGVYTGFAIRDELWKRTNGQIVEQRQQTLADQLGIGELPIEIRVTLADDVVHGILDAAHGFDQIIIGASEEGLLEQTLFGSIPQRVAEEAMMNVIMVKRHDLVKFGLRRWLKWPRRDSYPGHPRPAPTDETIPA